MSTFRCRRDLECRLDWLAEYHITRRSYQERYIRREDEHGELWRKRLSDIAHCLDFMLSGSLPSREWLQDLADMVDYGPKELSPKQRDTLAQITTAFDNSMSEQAEKCARGEHIYGVGPHKCWACGEPRFKVIEGEATE